MGKNEIFIAIRKHYSSEDLDESVHEIKSREATIINNGGMESQLEFLARSQGLDWLVLTFLEDGE